MKNSSLFLTSIISLLFIALPLNVFSFDRTKVFLEIKSGTNFEEVKEYLNGLDFWADYEPVYKYNTDCHLKFHDTIPEAHFTNDIQLNYLPKTKRLFEYHYSWDYRTGEKFSCSGDSISDTGSISAAKASITTLCSESTEERYIEMCIYFTDMYRYFCEKYGQPKEIGNPILSDFESKKTNIIDVFQLDLVDIHWLTKDGQVELDFYCADKASNNSVECSFSRGVEFHYRCINYNNTLLYRQEFSSIEKQKKMTEWIINSIILLVIAFIIVLVIVLVLRYPLRSQKISEEDRKRWRERDRIYMLEMEEKKKQEQIRINRLQAEHSDYLESLSEKYGACDRIIKLAPEEEDPYREILVYGETKHVVIIKTVYAFSDILDCMVNDDVTENVTTKTYHSPVVATTTVDSGNMFARAIAGNALFGTKGAIIGGSTANRNTIIEGGDDTVFQKKEIVHDYSVIVTIKDLKTPTIEFHLGDNTELKDNIYSLFRVIISMH